MKPVKGKKKKKFGVSRVILHELYDGIYNDLALIRLQQKIWFGSPGSSSSSFIRPICLPATEKFPDDAAAAAAHGGRVSPN